MKKVRKRVPLTIEECRLSNGLILKSIPNSPFTFLFDEVFTKRVYVPDSRFALDNCNTVIDIGANIGLFSMYAASMNPNIRIFSFEPAMENFKVLSENIQRNKFKNISAGRFAVTNSSRKVIWLNKHAQGGMHSIVSAANHRESGFKNSRTGRERVPTISLDDIFLKFKIEKCDYLKMDCEGAEHSILEGTSDSVFQKINRIAMEFHDLTGGKTGKKLGKLLQSKGFAVKVDYFTHTKHEGMIYALCQDLI